MMTDTELADNFKRYFFVRRAVSEQMKQVAFQVRYRVYCEELAFEDSTAFPDKLEQDGCDSYSDHFLIYHRGDQERVAGTIRLVSPQTQAQKLPVELHCFNSIDPSRFDLSRLTQGEYCELSRLAVTGDFRRRLGERDKPYVVEGGRGRLGFPNFPYIAVGLYMAAAASCSERGLGTVVVMMEPRMARHLARLGILFEQVGEVVDFHGWRAPYQITLESFFAHIKPAVRALYEHVAAEIAYPENQL
ncbi:PEP-CTERM/exosortase system-associated acyltransferase [Motiliproteus sp.]|uniref:PEP-CTERM/exosortase system-associated acyltransferase n=1 Tax=Motiliproteus sp. TaxID=1898955 RepID=UPI003BAAA81E